MKTVLSVEQIEKYHRAAFLCRPWPSSKQMNSAHANSMALFLKKLRIEIKYYAKL